jgi:hypothetical protein
MRLLRIPKGCKKVAWGKRSAAPGTLDEEARALKGRETSPINQGIGLASLQGAALYAHDFQGLRFACP